MTYIMTFDEFIDLAQSKDQHDHFELIKHFINHRKELIESNKFYPVMLEFPDTCQDALLTPWRYACSGLTIKERILKINGFNGAYVSEEIFTVSSRKYTY